MHGACDTTVIPDQSERLHAALRQAGRDSTLIIVPGGGHGFKDATQPHAARLALVLDFFDRVLKQPPPPARFPSAQPIGAD